MKKILLAAVLFALLVSCVYESCSYLVIDARGKGVVLTFEGYTLLSREGKEVFIPSMVRRRDIPPMIFTEGMPNVENACVVRALKVEGKKIYLNETYYRLKSIIDRVGKDGRIIVVGVVRRSGETQGR